LKTMRGRSGEGSTEMFHAGRLFLREGSSMMDMAHSPIWWRRGLSRKKILKGCQFGRWREIAPKNDRGVMAWSGKLH
jgi:hypothetical protein